MPAGREAAAAIAVHRNNALVAAQTALQDNYPVLRAMIGADGFAALALRHIRRQPPADPRLCLYGRGLATTIARIRPLAAWPWLADVARLEWLVVRALFAADAKPLRAPPSPSQRWPLAPATGWCASPHPVATLWAAHQPRAEWPAAFPDHGELALVTRAGAGVQVRPVARDALPLLDALRAGKTLADAASALPPAALAQLPTLARVGALIPIHGETA
ncbi:HvfC/BufC N-terminal domain-containing protein [Sphingomonas changnyeongensis]|uniref:HvfC/BufC N-terminal domain-containing protein n=1 Tax=Sphingomonas changnyeongensis TaxID=2698679 RepID=UPI001E613E6C|nr:DNA-binding domain-containing protein [Sphingomonas changnyeongensis]